jgi:hypothetical protein
MPNIGNLNLLNVILPYGPAAQSGIVAYYPSYGSANRIISSGGGPPVTLYYQTVQSGGVAQPQEAALNFIGLLQAADNSGNGSTDASIVPGSNGQVMTTTGGVAAWGAGGGSPFLVHYEAANANLPLTDNTANLSATITGMTSGRTVVLALNAAIGQYIVIYNQSTTFEITVDAECATIDGYGEFYTLPAWTGDGTMPYVVLLNPKILGGSQWKVIAESNEAPATDQGVIVQPPVAASWTQVNFAGGTSLTDVGTSLPGVNLYDTTTGANVTRAITRPLSGNYTITARLRPMIVPFLSPPGGGSSVSVCVSDGTKFLQLGLIFLYGGGVNMQVISNATASSAASVVATSSGMAWSATSPIWLRIQNNGTNRIYSWSSDGEQFIPFYTEGHTTFLTETVGGASIFTENSQGMGLTLDSFNP